MGVLNLRDIDDDLIASLKIKALVEGVSLKQSCADGLRAWTKTEKRSPAAQQAKPEGTKPAPRIPIEALPIADGANDEARETEYEPVFD